VSEKRAIVRGSSQYSLPCFRDYSLPQGSEDKEALHDPDTSNATQKERAADSEIVTPKFIQLCFYGQHYIGRVQIPPNSIVWREFSQGWEAGKIKSHPILNLVEAFCTWG
jgi:hypothetical protein